MEIKDLIIDDRKRGIFKVHRIPEHIIKTAQLAGAHALWVRLLGTGN